MLPSFAKPMGTHILTKLLLVFVAAKLLLVFVAAIFVLLAAVPANSSEDHAPSPDEGSQSGDHGGDEGGSDQGGDHGSDEGGSDEGGDHGSDQGGSDEGGSDSGDDPHGDDGDIELSSPPAQGDDDDDRDDASNDDNGTSINIGSGPRLSKIEAKFNRTKKELSRLFVLSDTEIAVEFPRGGFDEALVRAANRARRAEKAYQRRVNR